jgi:hypothetical protein
MPRARKKPATPGMTNPSSPANPLPSTPTGLPYGENKALTTAQQQIPQGSTPMPSAPAPTPTPGAPAPPPGTQPPNRFAAMLGAAQQFSPPNLQLGAPTNVPGEPITTPISGPTPAGPRVADTLMSAAQASGSSTLLALAQQAQRLGQ